MYGTVGTQSISLTRSGLQEALTCLFDFETLGLDLDSPLTWRAHHKAGRIQHLSPVVVDGIIVKRLVCLDLVVKFPVSPDLGVLVK